MDSLRQAQSYLERDPLRYMDMLEPIRRGMVEVAALREDGVLLYNLPGELYMLAADSVESAQALCAGVGEMELGRGPQPGDRGVSAKAGMASPGARAAPRRPTWGRSPSRRPRVWRYAPWARRPSPWSLRITTPSPTPSTSGSGWTPG